ncbi:MAG: SRPBCC domain-containing protein [Alphaproteobacteria bacterium]
MGLGPRMMTSQSGGFKVQKGPAPPVKIENRIGVQASSEVLWEILSDLPAWGEWCPIYPRAEGTLRIGNRLSLTLTLPDLPEREISPRVLDWVPYAQILWADTAWRSWVTTQRFIEIDELDKASCIVSNGEQFGGFLGDLFVERRRSAMKRGFLAFNEALKARAEAIWNARA